MANKYEHRDKTRIKDLEGLEDIQRIQEEAFLFNVEDPYKMFMDWVIRRDDAYEWLVKPDLTGYYTGHFLTYIDAESDLNESDLNELVVKVDNTPIAFQPDKYVLEACIDNWSIGSKLEQIPPSKKFEWILELDIDFYHLDRHIDDFKRLAEWFSLEKPRMYHALYVKFVIHQEERLDSPKFLKQLVIFADLLRDEFASSRTDFGCFDWCFYEGRIPVTKGHKLLGLITKPCLRIEIYRTQMRIMSCSRYFGARDGATFVSDDYYSPAWGGSQRTIDDLVREFPAYLKARDWYGDKDT